MAEITINLNIVFNRRHFTGLGVVAIMLCAVPELNSESVTLSTYYPAPSGVYTNMLTTGDTYLARDAGSVFARKILGTGNNVFSTADPKAADIVVGSDAGTRHDSSIMMWSNTSASRIFQQADTFYLSVWNQNPVTGAKVSMSAANGDATFSGAIRTRAGALCDAPDVFIYDSFTGGTTPLCSGKYVTTVAGFYTKYIALPIDRGGVLTPPVKNQFTYMCCPCPADGCDL
jgi:hypothetical protein